MPAGICQVDYFLVRKRRCMIGRKKKKKRTLYNALLARRSEAGPTALRLCFSDDFVLIQM